jgi:hypothetical protein
MDVSVGRGPWENDYYSWQNTSDAPIWTHSRQECREPARRLAH